MERKRRQQVLLAVLLLVLLAAVGYRYWGAPSGPSATTSNARGTRTASAGARDAQPGAAPEVRLGDLDAERPTPVTGERNLFRFKPRPAPPPPPPPRAAPGGTPASSPGSVAAPTGPPPPPPITLKFIGVIEKADHSKIAVLSDGQRVYEGGEGGTILGQYKILRIGVESIEMSYLDGRGRQTIRLTG